MTCRYGNIAVGHYSNCELNKGKEITEMLIKVNRGKFDFTGITIAEFLEYFGYKNPIDKGNDIFAVSTLGVALPAVEICIIKT